MHPHAVPARRPRHAKSHMYSSSAPLGVTEKRHRASTAPRRVLDVPLGRGHQPLRGAHVGNKAPQPATNRYTAVIAALSRTSRRSPRPTDAPLASLRCTAPLGSPSEDALPAKPSGESASEALPAQASDMLSQETIGREHTTSNGLNQKCLSQNGYGGCCCSCAVCCCRRCCCCCCCCCCIGLKGRHPSRAWSRRHHWLDSPLVQCPAPQQPCTSAGPEEGDRGSRLSRQRRQHPPRLGSRICRDATAKLLLLSPPSSSSPPPPSSSSSSSSSSTTQQKITSSRQPLQAQRPRPNPVGPRGP